jgi:hypothetical protein
MVAKDTEPRAKLKAKANITAKMVLFLANFANKYMFSPPFLS